MDPLVIGSFVGFTALVAVLTWWWTRKDNTETSTGYFLGGRSLTFPLIAGSLLLTNLSTEQLVGLNGGAFRDGLAVMVWEVVCVIALVFMAWFFLPRFLKSGVTTVPQYLGLRFDDSTRQISNVMILVAYVAILLPMVLYTGAVGLKHMLDVPGALASLLGAVGIAVDPSWPMDAISTWVIVWVVGIIGSIYALFGGLRSVAVSDTLNGIGLLVGGFLITVYAFYELGHNDFFEGVERFRSEQSVKLNSIGSNDTAVPFGSIFSGIFLLNLFYWTTNQQIIQRTFAASSLAEGQKGVLLCGLLKLFGPLYLVVPGMIAAVMFAGQGLHQDECYGKLVREVLPRPLTGFFAAAMIGAILSSFNSALNSACTLFSLDTYKTLINPRASEKQVVRSGLLFGFAIAAITMTFAPFIQQLEALGGKGVFAFLQKMNALYFIPIFAVVLVGMVTRRVPAAAANAALIVGTLILLAGYFVPGLRDVASSIGDYHFLGLTFLWIVVMMLVIGEVRPRAKEFHQEDVGAVDMTPWRFVGVGGWILIGLVILIYASFADLSVLKEPAPPTATETPGTPDVVEPDVISQDAATRSPIGSATTPAVVRQPDAAPDAPSPPDSDRPSPAPPDESTP